MSEKYRPSNGTEGHAFIESFCCVCARSEHLQRDAGPDALPGCPILDLTFLHDVDDAEYPEQWITDESGPRCTAFVREGEPVPTQRCTQTTDMFGGDA